MTTLETTDHAPPGPAPLLRLAAGVRVVRRGRDRVQVGLDPARRVVLPRDEPTTALLRRLARGAHPGEGTPRAVLEQLSRRGLLAPAAAPQPRRVVVRDVGRRAWPVDPRRLLTRDSEQPLHLVGGDPDAVLVLCSGEPDRDLLDPLVRDAVPHLVVSLLDGGARLGPLVLPGRTACLRCVDAHQAGGDPEHLAVLVRHVTDDCDIVDADQPEHADPAVAALVTAWALRDLAHLLHPVRRGQTHQTHQTPGAPASLSATLTWHPGASAPQTRAWLRHPGCGCGWATAWEVAWDDPSPGASGDLASGTMEA